MAVEQMHAATPATRDAAACASLPLKCPSPVTLEAMHIARQCGVLTDLEVGSAGDGRDPSRRVSGALVGSVLRYDDEKENIDPVTGVHARLASGVAAGTNARGASDPRSFPDAAPGATGARTRQPLADITPSFVNMERLKPGRSVLRAGAQGQIESVTESKRSRSAEPVAGADLASRATRAEPARDRSSAFGRVDGLCPGPGTSRADPPASPARRVTRASPVGTSDARSSGSFARLRGSEPRGFRGMSPRRDAEAPTPPAVVNVFKRCGASVTRSGRVSESVDKHLGRKALVVDGDVPAAHFVRLPKVGKPGLRLAGAYAYLQVRLDPARYFAAHIDVVCVDRARPTRSDASVDYQVGRKVVRVSVSNLYKADGSQKKKQRGSDTRRGESSVESFGAVTHHLQPPHAGWFCLRVDVRASVRDAQNANANERKEKEKEKDGTKKSATRLTFESIKGFHVGGAVSLRNVFVSETPFDEESAPAETRASTKPDAVITWLDAGPVDESFRTRENERSVQKRGEDEDELLETAGPVFSAAAPDLEPSDEDAKKTVVEETFGPTNKDAETTTRRGAGGSVATVREGGVFPKEIPSRESHSNQSSEPGGSDADAFLRASVLKSSAFDPRHASVTKHLDPALTLRAVIGASCETSASIAATRDGLVAYAADKAVVVVSLDDGNPGDVLEKTVRQQILLGHAEAVSCVRFSEDGEIMATAQRGAFPSVFLWRRGGEKVETGSGSGNETKKKKKPFALLASFRASCASAVSLALALCADGGTRVAILGDTPSGSFQTASLEVWDVPSGKPFGLASSDKEPLRRTGRSSVAKRTLFEVLKETTSATCVAFAPGRDDRLFACGDGFIVELTLFSCLKPGDDPLTLITKPACFKDLDLAALGTNDERESAETYAFTTLAFLSERTSEESNANEKETVSLFVGTRRGVVARFAVLDDDSDGDSNDPHAACAPECAFRLHDDAVASLAFFSEDERRFAATASADGTVRVWPADFSTAHLLEAAHDAPTRVVGAAFCCRTKSGTETDQDGLVVVTATSDGAVGCLDLSDKRYAFLTTSPSPSTCAGARAVTSVCHSRYGQIVCAACDDGAARGWDAATGALVFVCKETFDVSDRDPATSVCFRPFRDENADENARDVRDVRANSQRLVLAVGHASGAVRVFSLFSRDANEKDKKIGRGHSETQLACALVAEVKDAHAPGAAVDALAFAGRGAKKTLFSAARDGTLCAIERFIESPNTALNPSESWGTENERERFRASRRVRVGATGARASLAASPCGGYVLVAACAGSLGAAATGGSRSSSHVLAFDAETLVLKPPAMRNARGGVAALAASRRTKRTLPPRDRQTVTNDDDSSSSSDERSFSVFVAGDDAAAVVSRHNFDASWRANETVCVDGQNNCEASRGSPSTPLSAASLVRTAAEPISVLRDAHAPTRLARLKRHVKDAGDVEDGGGVLAATLGVAVHPAGHVVVTCGADGTLLVSPANAFADISPERFLQTNYESFGGSAEDASESATGAATDFKPCAQRFVGAHAGAARGVAFLPTDDPAGDSLLATVGEGRVLCVWDVHAAALGALEKNVQTVTEKKQGKSRRGAFAATSRARAFGLAPTPTSADAEAVSSHTKTQTSRSSFPSRLDETRATRAAPASAGYARAPPEPWTEPEPEPEPERLKNNERRLEGDSDDTDERENAFKKISAAFPSRVVGLAVGASAASAERTENAAAVAAAAAAPGALYVPELGALLYAAGAEVVIERVGSAKTQAVLRAPTPPEGPEGLRFGDALHSAPIGTTSSFTITALARHADSRRLASASPREGHGDHDATIRVWDSGTGALLFTATHDLCGGAVSALAFSPDGKRLLSLGGDPDGAVRVFSVPTFVRSDENEVKQPEKKPSRKTLVPAFKLATSQPVAAGAWLSNDAFFVVGAEGATAYFFGGETSSGNDHDHDHDRSIVSKTFPFRFEDESGDALDRTPVCTAATALERDGCEKNAEAFLGDSRGRVWACDVPTDFFGAKSGVSASPGLGLTFRPLRGASAGVPLAALPRGEAVTTLAAFTDATGVGVFVGSARRARVLFSEHPLRGTVDASERNARYWYELGELALDGAVTSSHATTFVSGGGRGESIRTAHAKLVTATTSAGTAWAVDTRTGNAKALLRAHAVDVADATSRGDALATVTTDGAARVWETSTFAKALEVFPDTREEPRCVTAALCGERVALAREDGTVRVVDFASRDAKSNGARWHTEDVVASKTSYAFAAHPGGGAIVAAAFVESLRDIDRNVPNAQTPLVSVATDGSVAVTEFFPNEDEEKGERLFGEGSAHTNPTRTKTTTVVPGGPGGVLPVRAAAFEDGVFPARVAAARDDAARVFSLRRMKSGALSASTDDAFATPRFAASLTFEHAPERRFEAFEASETVGESARDDVPGSNQGRSACVAWSAANAGVLYYAAAATGGHLLVLDARQGFKAFDGGEVPLAEARTSVVKLPFPEPNDSHGSHRTRCVAVASSRRGCAGDLIAVGGDRGCVFLEIAARDTAGFAEVPSGGAENIKNRQSGDGVSFSFETAPRRTSFFASQKPVVSVAWRDPSLHTDAGFGFGTRNDTDVTTAFVAAGADVYAFDDDALFRA